MPRLVTTQAGDPAGAEMPAGPAAPGPQFNEYWGIAQDTFFSFNAPRQIKIVDMKVGLLNRLIQVLFIFYIISVLTGGQAMLVEVGHYPSPSAFVLRKLRLTAVFSRLHDYHASAAMTDAGRRDEFLYFLRRRDNLPNSVFHRIQGELQGYV